MRRERVALWPEVSDEEADTLHDEKKSLESGLVANHFNVIWTPAIGLGGVYHQIM